MRRRRRRRNGRDARVGFRVFQKKPKRKEERRKKNCVMINSRFQDSRLFYDWVSK